MSSAVIKLANFFNDELSSEVKDLLVTKDQIGAYTLYSKYLVRQNNGGYYKVTVLESKASAEFSTLKNAVTWCTLHNARRTSECRRLEYLDLKLSSLMLDIAVHRQLLRNAKSSESKILYSIKMQDDNYKRRQVVQEINTLINNCKSIQTSKFNKPKQSSFRYLR